jgi:hypothetical protein
MLMLGRLQPRFTFSVALEISGDMGLTCDEPVATDRARG